MKLLEKNELRTLLIAGIVSVLICIGFNIGRDKFNHSMQIQTVGTHAVSVPVNPVPKEASTPVETSKTTFEHEASKTPRTADQWQMIASSLSPGFKVSRVLPIEGTQVTNLVDDRKDVSNLNSAIITVANDMSWWQDAQGFHLTVHGGSPINDPRASLKVDLSKKVIEDFPKEAMIDYPSTAPAGVKPLDVYLFVSLDCVYCRQVEANIAKYQAVGMNMHLIPFPRTGPNSPAWRLSEKIWCSPKAERPKLLSDAYASRTNDDVEPVADKDMPDPKSTCVSWVQQGFQDAVWLNIPGTPGVFNANGKLIGGYIPAENMRQVVEGSLASPN
jgi:protein-disulfide isomerase